MSKHLSDALDYSLRYPTSGSPELASSANRMSQPTATTQDPLRAAAERTINEAVGIGYAAVMRLGRQPQQNQNQNYR